MDLESSVRIEIKGPENQESLPGEADSFSPSSESPQTGQETEGMTADQLIRRSAEFYPNVVAFADPSNRAGLGLGHARSVTYEEAETLVSSIAVKFIEHGLKPGNIIAIQIPNIWETLVIIAAAWRARLAVVPLPMVWRLSEIHQAIAQLDPTAIVTVGTFAGHNHADIVREAASHHISIRHIFGLHGNLGDGISPIDNWFIEGDTGSQNTSEASAGSPDDTAIMTWADSPSGPYPVPRSHKELMTIGGAFVHGLHLTGEDKVLNAYPFTSITSVGGQLIAALLAHAPLILHQPFDYGSFVSQLRDHGITYTAVPAAVINTLHSQGDLAGTGITLSRLGCIWPTPHSQSRKDTLPDLDIPLFDICNLGELALLLRSHEKGANLQELPLGKLQISEMQSEESIYLETRVRGCVAPQTGGDEGQHMNGTLFVRGNAVPSGPFTQAGALTQSLLLPDSHGYLDTGIACKVDESRAGLFRCEPSRELIYHGGTAVGFAELDRLYSEFPGFLDAVAFAIDDPIMGERIFAAVIPKPDTAPSLIELKQFLNEKGIAPYKSPDQLVTVTSIPRTPDGSVLRDQILGQI